MSRIIKILLFAALLVTVLAGCDLFTDNPEYVNQAPTAWFVNYPSDYDTFSYAPIVYWQGFDPDGEVNGFEYYDDTTSAGLAAYRGTDAEWLQYLAGLSQTSWTFTEEASRQIFLFTEIGDTTEHIFLIRAVDDKDARSEVVGRTFFRTNQPPNPPRIRWAESDTSAYFVHEVVPDTQLVGDTITITYNGVRLLWQGDDPDGNLSNIIPLTFSYALINSDGDSIEIPVRNDSNQVVGYRAGFTNWGNQTQISLFGLESGDYTFLLRVMDDGFTVSDSIATCDFKVVKPTLSRLLLIVDDNKALTGPDAQRGGIHPDTLMAVYRGSDGSGGLVAEAMDIANELGDALAQFQPQNPHIRHFDYDSVAWLDNRTSNPLPYDYISQFASIWIIDDDNQSPIKPLSAVQAYNKVLADYMNIGGNVMWTGRRILNKDQGITAGTPASNTFLSSYFNIFTTRSKNPYNAATPAGSGIPDFVGAVAGDAQWPDLEVNPLMTARLNYLNQSVPYPPEVEYFGRSNAPASFDFGTTVYNYKSSTSDTLLYPNLETAYDCSLDVDFSTATVIALVPRDETLPLLSASVIYNRTKGKYADFVEVRNVGTNILAPKWRIFASVNVNDGTWLTSDTLEVTYRFIPLSADHDEPIGINFVKYAGTIEIEINGNSVRTRVNASPVFRSSMITFPLAFMKNETYAHPYLGDKPAVSLLIADQLVFFNQNLDVHFE